MWMHTIILPQHDSLQCTDEESHEGSLSLSAGCNWNMLQPLSQASIQLQSGNMSTSNRWWLKSPELTSREDEPMCISKVFRKLSMPFTLPILSPNKLNLNYVDYIFPAYNILIITSCAREKKKRFYNVRAVVDWQQLDLIHASVWLNPSSERTLLRRSIFCSWHWIIF